MNSGNQIWDEADIGSGEKTAGQRETEELIRQIPVLPADSAANDGDADAGGDAGRAGRGGARGATAELGPEAGGLTMEQEQSLDKDEPGYGPDQPDPVPPRG